MFEVVPIDKPNLLYLPNENTYVYSDNYDLAICSNSSCGYIAKTLKELSKQNIYSFNIWFSSQNMFDEDLNVPICICAYCMDEHVESVKCSMCKAKMPSLSYADKWKDVHSFHDSDYVYHPICKVCSTITWKKNISCFCGSQVDEIDMVQLVSPYSFLFDIQDPNHNFEKLKALSSYYYSMTHDSEFVHSKEDSVVYQALQIVIEKVCKSCSSLNGQPTVHTFSAVEKFINSTFEDFNQFLHKKHLTSWQWKNSHMISVNIDDPSLKSTLLIKNPGKVGYIRNYNTIF